MEKKLTRQQRRKIERVAKKGLSELVSSKVSASDDVPAEISVQSPARIPNRHHTQKLSQPANNSINEHQYKPSSLGPCYLIEEDGTKSIWLGGWVPFQSSVEIANLTIDGGVYIGTPSTQKMQPKLKKRAEVISINPDLDIIDFKHGSKYQMISNDLAYSNMTPSDRGNYLKFLASGACDDDFDVKFMLTYFLGLEFRYFFEKRNQLAREDMDQFMDKIDFLKTLYYPNPIMTQLELFKRMIFHDRIQSDLQNTGLTSEEGSPFLIRAIEGGLLVMGDQPLKHYHVVQLFNRFPEEKISIMREAACYVFDRLFESKFNHQYPNGLKIDPSNEILAKHYISLCQNFSITEPIVIADRVIPDICESKKVQSVAQKIGNAVTKELKPYINEIKSNTEAILRENEIIFLPDGGANEIKNKADELIESWILERMKQQEPITYGEIMSLFKTESAAFTVAEHWYQALVAFHRVGYGLAPDLMLFLWDNHAEDEVVLFKYSTDFNDRTKSSGNFNSELFSLAIGCELMFEMGEDSDKIFNILKQRLQKVKGLTVSEFERLEANFKRMQIVPPSCVIFDFIETIDYKINSDIIRESLIYYAEHCPLLISEHLADIFLTYKMFKLDVRTIESDFQLTGTAQRKYQKVLIRQQNKKKKE